MSSDFWSGHCVVDPHEMESRYSTLDSMAYIESIFEEPSEESTEKIEKIREILDLLPPIESDFVRLYYFHHLRQTAIAQIFQVSQPTVCYRLQRAADRIQFILEMPDLTSADVENAMRLFLTSEENVQIMVLMFETTCQSEVAKRLGASQGKIRHRFVRSLEKMREVEGLETYVKLFDSISDNLNILREVSRTPGDDVTYIVD